MSDEIGGSQGNKSSILDFEPEQLTPGMRQYLEVKRSHPDCLVMLRMGDFYEMFYEDAITAARELEITLTSRGKGEKRAPLAGVPFHALDTYLGRLVKKGFKVAIVEQLEDPKLAKGLVKRGLVRIVTPGTVIESSLLNEKENNYLVALTSFGDQYALASCDLSTGEFSVTSIRGQPQLFHELARLNPRESIIPQSLQVDRELLEQLKRQGCFLTTLEDYFFRPEKAAEILRQHFQLQTLSSFGLDERSLSTAVAGALLHYLISTQKNSLSHIKKITHRHNQETMLLDFTTIRNLELLGNIRDGSLKGSLLSVLDHTMTAMGARLLRRWIKQPLLQKDKINQRLDSVQALKENIIAREEIMVGLSAIQDLERLISRVNYGNATPREVLALRNSLQLLPLVKQKISSLLQGSSPLPHQSQGSSNPLLTEIATLPDFSALTSMLAAALRDDAPITIREGGIIRQGYNSELDEWQKIKTHGRDYLQQWEEQERQRTGISTLKIGYTDVFGYFIEITKKNLHLVPRHYLRKQTTANAERYITEELKQWEEKILSAEEKIVELEYTLFQALLTQIVQHTSEIQDAASKVAVLDVLCCLAKVAAENNYRKPELVEHAIIHLHHSRHPVIERMTSNFIANDIRLDEKEMIIITGPNMSGKSTLMRQVALTVLLAQIGSFVPADKAVLGIVDRIFTRVGAYDDLSSGQSTFMIEMSETAAILNNATEKSLIILDEIGRGTSTFDGVAIAWSVAEHLYHQIKARTLFSTHYHVLNKLTQHCPRIRNYNLAVREVKDEIIFLRKLVEGGTDQSYGIHVAQLAGLPSEVVNRAREIQALLEKDDEMMRKLKGKRMEEQVSLGRF